MKKNKIKKPKKTKNKIFITHINIIIIDISKNFYTKVLPYNTINSATIVKSLASEH